MPFNVSDLINLDEYTALQKYISTYRDPKLAQQEEQANNHAESQKKKPWQVCSTISKHAIEIFEILTIPTVLEEGRSRCRRGTGHYRPR